MKWKPKLYN